MCGCMCVSAACVWVHVCEFSMCVSAVCVWVHVRECSMYVGACLHTYVRVCVCVCVYPWLCKLYYYPIMIFLVPFPVYIGGHGLGLPGCV